MRSPASYPNQRVGIFVDVQNLYHSARNIYHGRVNYEELIKHLVGDRQLIRAMAYVVKPFGISDLTPAIEIAVSRHRQLKALQSEVADLQERLDTRKVIDRAKGILMSTLKLSEPEAFSWIQRTAMDRRISMKAVAQAVISPDAVPFL